MSRSDKRVAVFARKRCRPKAAEGANVADIANISFTVVGACIARPLIGNGFFLKQIGMIGQLG